MIWSKAQARVSHQLHRRRRSNPIPPTMMLISRKRSMSRPVAKTFR
jgi:hypothetical protein